MKDTWSQYDNEQQKLSPTQPTIAGLDSEFSFS